MMDMNGPFFFNGNSFDMERIDYTIPINNIEIWQLTNNSMVAHPFHIHDVQFYLLTRNGNLPPMVERGRKDVVLVQPMETVRFITKFEDFADTTIPYMFHCHILMHEDDGMMGQFVVAPAALSMNERSNSQTINIYPNPSGNMINIDLTEAGNFNIYDNVGRLVHTGYHTDNFTLDVSAWAQGLYTLVIQNDKTLVRKFSVSR
jgi:bilirubin oxidase